MILSIENRYHHHHHHHPSASAEIPRTTSRHTSRSHMAARRSSTSNPASLDITLGKVNLLDLTGRWLGLHRRRRDTASPSARQQCPANSNLLLASLAEIGGSSPFIKTPTPVYYAPKSRMYRYDMTTFTYIFYSS